jgi:hypothetical protein
MSKEIIFKQCSEEYAAVKTYTPVAEKFPEGRLA